MIARFLGIILVLVPVFLIVTLFVYWLKRRIKKDEITFKKEGKS